MLVQKIKADMVTAMKARNDLRVQTLRGSMAAFTNELVVKGMKPTDALDDVGALTVLKRLSKQRRDSAEQFEKGGRPELAQKELSELAIIAEYLPQMASREDIQKVAEKKIQELGITDVAGMGKLMGAIIKEFNGNADGNDVKEVLSSLLKK